MDGALGGWVIKPDQIQVAGSLFVLVLLPVFDAWLHPALHRCGLLTTPLQRIPMGGLMAAAAYVMAGGVQLMVQKVRSEPNYTPNPSTLHLQVSRVWGIAGSLLSFSSDRTCRPPLMLRCTSAERPR